MLGQSYALSTWTPLPVTEAPTPTEGDLPYPRNVEDD